MVHFENSYSQGAVLSNGIIYFVVTNDTQHSGLHYDVIYSREDSESVVDPTMTTLEGYHDWYRVKKSVCDKYLEMGYTPKKVCLCCMVDQEKRYYQEIPIVASSSIPPLVKPKSHHVLSVTATPRKAMSNPNEDDWGPLVFEIATFIISICVFFFYAYDEFGVLPGILYSVFWPFAIPIHLLFY